MEVKCTGWVDCCSSDFLCGLGEGNCKTDPDCKLGLACRANICPTVGQQWDSNDKCCKNRCTNTNPCSIGQGHCEVDSDCTNPTVMTCKPNSCLDRSYFPLESFPANTNITSDKLTI
jgi:hypothetical protein